jgi:uncharacterized protein YbjT (DUF2867 family)
MIMVTGATGNLGRSLVDQLSTSGQTVRALTRDANRARLPGSVEVVEGDLTQPDSLHPALKGVDALFLVMSSRSGDAASVLEVARQAGVRRVVMVSTLAAQNHPDSAVGRGSLQAEHALGTSGLSWTVLRPTQFASNTLWWAPMIRTGGIVRAPFAHVALPTIHPGDIAAVARVALTEDGHHGKTYPLTGPQALTPPQLAQAIGAALGRDLVYEELTVEQAREQLAQQFPVEIANSVLDLMGRTATDADSVVLSTVEQVTGEPARTFQQWARDHVEAFR